MGYQDLAYAASLAEFGQPQPLPRCGGWILRRPISGFAAEDGMGGYPLFACCDWTQLPADLAELSSSLVSLALVTDPFGAYDLALLRAGFDRVVHFKEHFVTDLHQPLQQAVVAGHRKRARQGLRQVQVELCADPLAHLDEWHELYSALIERHALHGLQAFSRVAFAAQLALPGMVMLRALAQERTVAATLWLVHGQVAYGHLAACSDQGYRLRAAYALDWSALEHFAATPVRWLHWGAGAGVEGDGEDGLSYYKRGWSTGTRPVYFCGRIFDQEQYARITQARSNEPTYYFPAYRQGEFR